MQQWLQQQLAELEAAGLLRDPADARARANLEQRFGASLIDASSNDYLGLGAASVSRETLQALASSRLGAGASRLVQGTFPEHEALEAELAHWTRAEATLLCTSAFAANVGTLPVLGDSATLLVSDRLNHASIVDGCRLARAKVVVTQHLQLEAIELALKGHSGGRSWVVTEALFSMDGDSPDLPALRALCDRYGAGLLLDEAHSLGILGPEGAGLAAAEGAHVDALIGGFGKAVGAQGGFVAGSTELRSLLWNQARPAVFTTAPSPLLSRLLLERVRQVRSADAARELLATRSAALRAALTERGLPVGAHAQGPIVPLLLGDNERALRVMRLLRDQGILVQAIRPPTVPVGEARLRLTVRADWPEHVVPHLAAALEVACAS